MKITRDMFISGPYRDCPKCKSENTFGVFIPISGSSTYQRECTECSHEETFPFPSIKKKVVYLDQFILSNLTILLDSSHPKHKKIKGDQFWTKLFEKLEYVSKSQAVIFPDSFFHKNESAVGKINFQYIRRLYEHLSSGKTFFPDYLIEREQISKHFENWLQDKKTDFTFSPENISFEGDKIHEWTMGIGISVSQTPKEDEINDLVERNKQSQKRLSEIWSEWKQVKEFDFIKNVRNEALSLRFHITNVVKFYDKQKELMLKVAKGEKVDWTPENIFPPTSKHLLDDLMRKCRLNNVPEPEIVQRISDYFSDYKSLLQIPKIKISSVMYANLSRDAHLGKTQPPKSFVDFEFISSFLPYCDAMFIDIESKRLLTELPKDTPSELRLDEFTQNIFTLRNKDDFLTFLDSIIDSIPKEQIKILKDVSGENYYEPYWGLIENEKNK